MTLSFFKVVPKSHDCPTGHLLLNDYGALKLLGEGGMGQVFLVRSISTGAQFAVKRTKNLGDSDRKNFIAELQTWIDLPDHPNLVACRFFRTFAGEVLIFAEYVAGGSLKDWIESRKIYEGGHEQSLERILDIAIQLATVLDFVHQLGLVHQDIKPGNILMASDGVASGQRVKPQVTDFGLARARAAGGEDFEADSYDDILVSSIRGTPAYWSPEQSKGTLMTHKADIWSWGVTVMELFTGGVTWMSGLRAAEVLEQYLQEGEYDEAIPTMPTGIAELLRECFCPNPQDRPASLAVIVDALQMIYLDDVGHEYDRTRVVFERSFAPQIGIHERLTRKDDTWTDPRIFLEEALSADGRESSEATSIIVRRGTTRDGILVAEMAMYEEAKCIFVKLVRCGNEHIKPNLATLCINKALVHKAAGDIHGAIMEYDQAINLLKKFTEDFGNIELIIQLVHALVSKAHVLEDGGDYLAALDSHQRAVNALEFLVNAHGRLDLESNLAYFYSNMAGCFSLLGNSKKSLEFYDKSLNIIENLVNHGGRNDLANCLAQTYMNKSTTIKSFGDVVESIKLYDKSIEIYKNLIYTKGRIELENNLAHVYVNKANSLSESGDKDGAMLLYDKALAIREKLVIKEERKELANDLAWIYDSKADVASQLGDEAGALELYDKAIAIQEKLVIQEGRKELASGLAVYYSNKARLINYLGDSNGAIELYDKAMAIQSRLIEEGRIGIKNNLALNYINKADAIGDSGNQLLVIGFYNSAIILQEELFEKVPSIENARHLVDSYSTNAERLCQQENHRKSIPFYDKSIVILESLIEQTEIVEVYLEFASALARAYTNKGIILNILDDGHEAIALHEKAIVIQEQLVNQHGLFDILGELAQSKGPHGLMLLNQGEVEQVKQAMDEIEFALKTLQDEVSRTGREDLKGSLDSLTYYVSEYFQEE